MLNPFSLSLSLSLSLTLPLSFTANSFSISLLCSEPFFLSLIVFSPQPILPPPIPPNLSLVSDGPTHLPFQTSNPFPLYRCYVLQTSLIPPLPSPTHTIAAENHPSKPFFLWQSLCDEDDYFHGYICDEDKDDSLCNYFYNEGR